MDRLLNAVVECSLDGIFTFDRELRFTVWNRAMEALTGLSSESILGQSALKVFPRIQGTETEKNYHNVLLGKKIYIEEQEFTYPHKNEKGYFEANWAPLFDERKEIVGGVCVVRDITQRKVAEIERNRFFNESNDLHLISSMDGMKRVMNPAFEKLLGYTNAETDRMGLMELIHPDDVASSMSKLSALTEGARETDYENRFICKDGSVRALNWSSVVKGEKIYATARDVTELREMERKLAERDQMLVFSSKMATLGEMAGGIAHEINTPLATISMTVEILKQMIEKNQLNPDYFKKELGKIEATSFRIAKIVSGLKMFSRDAKKDPVRLTNVSTIIEDTLALCFERFKNNGVELIYSPVPDSMTLRCRGVQISQVLLNLISNAFDAIKKADEKKIWIEVQENAQHIELFVRDSGPGIPMSIRERIMNPFFTTKPIGEGTGLGLSISYGIVQSHGGALELVSESQKTTFKVTLPKTGAPL